MSKLLATFTGLACFAWVFVWSWWFSNEKSPAEKEPTIPSTSLSITDLSFNFSASNVFSFHQSDASPVVPADNLALFRALARHLGENPDRELELTGTYAPLERNQTSHPNLGIARAKAIEKLLLAEGAPDDQMVTSAITVQNHILMEGRIVGGVNFNFNDIKKTVVSNQGQTVQQPENQPFAKTRADGVRVFFYKENEHELSDLNRPFLDSLVDKLQKNQRQTVILSGFSQPSEEKTATVNLAELRAKSIRRYLVDNGLRRKQIVLVSSPGIAKTANERRVEVKIDRE